MHAYTMSAQALTEQNNQAKEVFVETMLKNGVINEDMAETLSQYSIVVAEKSYFGKLWNKVFFKGDYDGMTIVIVKVMKTT